MKRQLLRGLSRDGRGSRTSISSGAGYCVVDLLSEGAQPTTLWFADSDRLPVSGGADLGAEHDPEHGLLAEGSGHFPESPVLFDEETFKEVRDADRAATVDSRRDPLSGLVEIGDAGLLPPLPPCPQDTAAYLQHVDQTGPMRTNWLDRIETHVSGTCCDEFCRPNHSCRELNGPCARPPLRGMRPSRRNVSAKIGPKAWVGWRICGYTLSSTLRSTHPEVGLRSISSSRANSSASPAQLLRKSSASRPKSASRRYSTWNSARL